MTDHLKPQLSFESITLDYHSMHYRLQPNVIQMNASICNRTTFHYVLNTTDTGERAQNTMTPLKLFPKEKEKEKEDISVLVFYLLKSGTVLCIQGQHLSSSGGMIGGLSSATSFRISEIIGKEPAAGGASSPPSLSWCSK